MKEDEFCLTCRRSHKGWAKCVFCGNRFARRSRTTISCGDPQCLRESKYNHNVLNRRPKTRTIHKKTCIECGRPFETINKPQRYCSHRCAGLARERGQRRKRGRFVVNAPTP